MDAGTDSRSDPPVESDSLSPAYRELQERLLDKARRVAKEVDRQLRKVLDEGRDGPPDGNGVAQP